MTTSDHFGKELVITRDDMQKTQSLRLRAVRLMFSALKITNDEYLERYRTFFLREDPTFADKHRTIKATADRRLLKTATKLTPNMMKKLVGAMGYEIRNLVDEKYVVSMDLYDAAGQFVRELRTENAAF